MNDRITDAYENHNLAQTIKNYWNKQTQIKENWEHFNIRLNKYEPVFNEFGINNENITIEQFNVKINSNEFKNNNFAISFIYHLQQKLNPNKYNKSIHEIIPSDIQVNVMCLLYYIANQLVLLSHDVIYSINNKINNILNIIKQLSETLELVAESIKDNGLIIKLLQNNKHLLGKDKYNFK